MLDIGEEGARVQQTVGRDCGQAKCAQERTIWRDNFLWIDVMVVKVITLVIVIVTKV